MRLTLKRFGTFAAIIIAILIAVFALYHKGSKIESGSSSIGEDKNGNQVWDDVEEKITTSYAYDPTLVKGLFQLAVAMQKSVSMTSPTEEQAIEIAKEIDRAQNCIYELGADNIGKPTQIESWIINDAERTKRYIHYNSLISGHQIEEIRPHCNFEVEE